MKNFFKKTTLIPILFAMFIYSPLITSHATHLETQTKRQSLQKGSVVQDQHVFAIPDNGWNVVDIELDYYESYYSSTNTQNAFPFRQKFYMIKRSGAGANNISVDVSNALHTDGTNKVIISPFQQGDLLVDTSKWEWGWYYFNTTVKYYPKNTTYKGQITYLLTCPDGIPMAYSNSATIPLATK